MAIIYHNNKDFPTKPRGIDNLSALKIMELSHVDMTAFSHACMYAHIYTYTHTRVLSVLIKSKAFRIENLSSSKGSTP